MTTLSIGTRSNDSVTISSVTGSDPAYTVTLSAAVPSTTKVGDRITDSASNKFLITAISGSDLTCRKSVFGSASDPATGAATTQRAYATVDLFETGAPDLVSTTQDWDGEVWNDSVLAGFTISGINASATYSVSLTAAPGQSFADHANKLTNTLKYNSSNGVCIGTGGAYANLVNLSQSYLTISRLQFKQANAGGTTRTVDAADGYSGVVIRECILENQSNDTVVVLRGTGAKIINCLVVKSTSNATTGDAIDLLYGAKAYACTAVKTSDNAGALAIGTYGGDATVVNCAMFGFATALSSSGYTGTNYNATDTSGMADSGPNDVESLTYANQFENTTDASMDFRAKSGNGLAAGTRDASNTNDLDIIGQARSTTTPTIGCWEFVSGGGNISVTPSAAIARALGIAPTLVLGSTSATPSAAIAKAAAIAPTTVLGSISIAPAAAIAKATALIGDVVYGSLVVAPAAAIAKAAAIIGTVIGGSGLTVTASAAIARCAAIVSSVVLGSVAVTPSAAVARAAATLYRVIDGGTTTLLRTLRTLKGFAFGRKPNTWR